MGKKTVVLLGLTALLLTLSACGNKIDSKLAELENKPVATDVDGAKERVTEANNLVRWLQDKEKPSAQQLERAQKLRDKRAVELGSLLLEKAKTGILGFLGALNLTDKDGAIDAGKVLDWVLGTNDPRRERFGAKDPKQKVDPLKDGDSRDWR